MIRHLLSAGGALCLQQPGHGHQWFPIARGGAPRGARANNLIVIQTVPMEGDSESVRQLPAAEQLPGSRSQPPPSSSALSTALLRPQDKWETSVVAKPKRMSGIMLVVSGESKECRLSCLTVLLQFCIML